MNQALLLIDLQNDYFPGGAFPLWNADQVLANVESLVARARGSGVLFVHVQHVADPAGGIAPFFNKGTPGADIHPRVLATAPDAPVVVKAFADSFHHTTLEQTLAGWGVTDLLVCGMMTQNCVTHTAISKAAEKYRVSTLPDFCNTVSEILHLIALHAVSTRVSLRPSSLVL